MNSTAKQRQYLHGLMRKHGLDEEAMKELKLQATYGRTDSSRQMSFEEADGLIKSLGGNAAAVRHSGRTKGKLSTQAYEEGNALRRYFFSLIYQSRYMAQHLGMRNKSKVAFAILNNFCIERSQFKAPLNTLTKQQLAQLKPVLEKVVQSSWQALRNLDK